MKRFLSINKCLKLKPFLLDPKLYIMSIITKKNFSAIDNNNNSKNDKNKKENEKSSDDSDDEIKNKEKDSVKNTQKMYRTKSNDKISLIKNKSVITGISAKDLPSDFNNDDNQKDELGEEEKKSLEKFAEEKIKQRLGYTGKNDEKHDDEDDESIPLIYFNQPLLPYSKITINNPNKNDLFFGLILKYGKLKVIDDETTLIQDICLFHQKDEMFKLKSSNKDTVLATKCEIIYKKGKLVIKALDTVYRVKTYKPGKYKFFHLRDASRQRIAYPSISILNNFENLVESANLKYSEAKLVSLNTYIESCLDSLSSITTTVQEINKNLETEEEYFGENNHSFSFKFSDIIKANEFLNKEFGNSPINNLLQFLNEYENVNTSSNNNTDNETDKFSNTLTINDNDNTIDFKNKKRAENNNNDNTEIKYNSKEYHTLVLKQTQILVAKLFNDLIRFSYYFTLKAHVFSQIINGNTNTIEEILNVTDLRDKLVLTKIILGKVHQLIDIKYNKYNFPKSYRLNIGEPFRNKNEEDLKLINKYKEVIETKISEIDQIEKEKDSIAKKLSEIKNMPTEVREVVEKELNKISSVNFESENGKRFEYLNHILSLPWDKRDDPKWDINYAKEILDKNLYGLHETKQRIYEFIAKNMRTNNKKGCVLLLSGGPGTGKTRIAKLIGEALQRKVGFISLAGISDGKTVLGFKRTYISSTPGLFVREMQKVNSINPVIVVDEIDKINVRYGHSNVFNALLQLLNPEENSRFTDHYLEIPFDFSNVIFILTSNNYDIFAPLLDRMEVIKVDPYVYYEKYLIAKKYALKQILKEYHLEELEITDKALYDLIYNYCKNEAGVRKLKKLLENIVRKITAKIELGELEDLLKEGQVSNSEKKILSSTVDSKTTDFGASIDQKLLLKYLQINSKNIYKILDEANNDDSVLANIISNRHKLGEYGLCIGLFVSQTDQLNSWGDASIFSIQLRQKKLKKLEFGTQIDHLQIDDKSDKDEKESSQVHENKNIENIDSLIFNNDNKQLDKKNLNSKNSKKQDKEKENGLLKEKSLDYSVKSTGNLGEDSIQSLNIALDLAGEFLLKKFGKKYENFFFNYTVHYDCPQILQKKSGPSAGVVAFLCSMSAALKKPIIPNIAMTGEVAIDGSVLKIGGVKEKCQGAQRYGVTTLVLPIGNKTDFMGLQENLKNSFNRVFFAKTVDDIYEIGFDGNTSEIECFEGKYDSSVNIQEETIMKNNLLDKLF